MDKNFVKIDDLVRQRLRGGEEEERAGAWTNMRELLDKEMPQERPGGLFNWRRMFSATAVLLLIGTIGVGGYKVATSENSKGQNADVIASSSVISTPGSVGTVAKNNELNKQISTSGVSGTDRQNDQGVLKTNDKQIIVANEKNEVNKPQTISNNDNKTYTAKDNSIDNKLNKSNNKLTANNNNTSGHIAGVAIADKKSVTATSTSVNTNNKYANTNETQDAKEIAKDASRTSHLSGNNHPSSIVVTSASDKKGTASNEKKITNKTEGITTGKQNGKEAAIASNVSGQHRQGQVVNTTDKVKSDKGVVALNNKTNAATQNNVTKANTAKTQNVSVNKMALSSHVSSVKSNPGVSADRVIKTKTASNKSNQLAGTNTAYVASKTTDANVPVFVTPSGKKIPGDRFLSYKNDIARIRAANNGKKVIQKMDLLEHYIKTTPTGEGFYKLDTISNISLTEELGVIIETKGTTSNTAPVTGAANTTSTNKAIGETEIVPAASASTTNKTEVTAKENVLSKKSGGASALENLNSAFNDIKYHIAGVQFAPGLTAGVNGTFFGPNSFKGFQLGLAGNIVFSDHFSVLAELKYFHRINNNYSMNDNYYTYTPVNGGYNKQLLINSYNFSTLHSFEMPISIRYCQGKFDFYSGGNLVYSFAINTGAASQADPTNTATTQAVGNDNTPKLKVEDFGARFGIGYLFGMSYHISPNVMLDLRSVQTVWNNARSDGEKLISDQLYKSPSLQLSFGYRLGGNKNVEK